MSLFPLTATNLSIYRGSLNLTYRESLLDCFKRYFASPRMWPIGYIGVSPYSPLSLEREMPSRNWRDAFEDLLALESGGEMIDYESREKEAITAERLWREELFEGVSTVNRQLQRDEKCRSFLIIPLHGLGACTSKLLVERFRKGLSSIKLTLQIHKTCCC